MASPTFKSVKIALIGYGKMGKQVESQAINRGHEIVAIVAPSLHTTINDPKIDKADICIDFTHPETILKNMDMLSKRGKSLVIGTSGWYDQLPFVENLVKERSIGLFWTPNFSLGGQLFIKIVEEAAKLFNRYPHYDVAGIEYHHRNKKDAPSGTAKQIAKKIVENLPRKTKVQYALVDRAIDPHELHFPSVRMGSVPGTHTVMFDSPADQITLTHEARNREDFALGAVLATEWLKGKKGIFTMEDFLA